MASVLLKSLSASSGDVAGGYEITLTGIWSSVVDTYSVMFGDEPATNVTVIDNNTITCQAPAHDQETVNVILTNETESISSTLVGGFAFLNPGSTTLKNMRNEAKQLADMVNNPFITDAEWNSYLNASYYELYDILVQKFGDDYFVASPYQFTTTNNQQLYTLPSNFYKLLGAEVSLNTGSPSSWVTLKQFNFIDRNKWNYPNSYAYYGITNIRYRLSGRNIMLAPIPQAGQIFQIWYIPRNSLLTGDNTIVDGISGWEQYVLIDACIKAWNKQESDVTVFALQKQALLKRIEEAAENRDVGEATTVSDIKSVNFSTYNQGGGSWSNGGV